MPRRIRCRSAKGKFIRCHGKSRPSHLSGLEGTKSCKFGVSKKTGRCLKGKRARRRSR